MPPTSDTINDHLSSTYRRLNHHHPVTTTPSFDTVKTTINGYPTMAATGVRFIVADSSPKMSGYDDRMFELCLTFSACNVFCTQGSIIPFLSCYNRVGEEELTSPTSVLAMPVTIKKAEEREYKERDGGVGSNDAGGGSGGGGEVVDSRLCWWLLRGVAIVF
ncbi:hypothetical protein M8C21_012181 [Ambrosia artemisiifolia]|uniref:Uncharacterized protein n=1 Tax=Ambrosia artemisiifolia TaxID=4212 RepID=A0AAD5GBN5_AMBAR|nr:hypothetical protein M8C21_012181 [Ambrosia artemisiifolia]